jgi:release factor glutamine methyltransferase
MVSFMLAQGTGRLLSGPHRVSARRDAELLLMHLLEKERAWLIAHADDDLGFNLWKPYYQLIHRRNVGEPIQYITGQQEFYGLPFRVAPDVLIPRPETEHLVEKALELAASLNGFVKGCDFSFEPGINPRPTATTNYSVACLAPANAGFPRILDVGTGSGAIAVTLAHHLPNAQITAIDISASALQIARENAASNSVADRIRFLESDLLSSVEFEKFEVVVSNPPYVPDADRESLSVEVRDHEPALALFAGEDGLDIYRRLIPEAFAVLESSGYLLMEIGYGQSASVEGLLAQAGFESIEFVPDLQGILRVACGRRP